MKKLLFFFLFLFLTLTGFNQTRINSNYQSSNFDDLIFLKKFIGDNKIVCLGEEWHRNEMFNEIKNRLVKYLHKELGFQVIIYESAIYGGLVINQQKLKGKEELLEILPTIWRTKSLMNLINYIDSTKKTPTPLIQMGLDVGGGYTNRFSNYLKSILLPFSISTADSSFIIDSTLQAKWIKWQSSFNSNSEIDSVENKLYRDHYSKLISLLIDKRSKLTLKDNEYNLLLMCLKNRIYQSKLISVKSKLEGFRDKIMSENLLNFIKKIYPNKKIIVWAAHLHITKSMKDSYKSNKGIQSMIQLLPDSIKNEISCIDLKPFKNAPKQIKKKIKRQKYNILFFDLSKPAFRETYLESLQRQFDGVIFCRKSKDIKSYMITK